ncbi:hypothetical protein EVA_04921 [gut metagenome]|uniref:Uncharacterized protein n=1 Tax=gut metagenome TaxID=749906 RepID=J9GVN0_9ZZZZ
MCIAYIVFELFGATTRIYIILSLMTGTSENFILIISTCY